MRSSSTRCLTRCPTRPRSRSNVAQPVQHSGVGVAPRRVQRDQLAARITALAQVVAVDDECLAVIGVVHDLRDQVRLRRHARQLYARARKPADSGNPFTRVGQEAGSWVSVVLA